MDDIKYLRRHTDEVRGTNASIIPICIVVDTSRSMKLFKLGDLSRMDRLNEGIQQFLCEIKRDDMLSDSVEIAVVTFEDEAEVLQNFSTIDNIEQLVVETKTGSGDTPKGVDLALKVLEKEKEFLKNNKSKYSQPWLVIFSDGRATPSAKYRKQNGSKDYTDINRRLNKIQKQTREMEANNKLTVIPVLINEKTDKQYNEALSQMKGFSAKGRVLTLGNNEESLSFKDFFKILSRSVSVSNADLLFRKDMLSNSNQDTPATQIKNTIQSSNLSSALEEINKIQNTTHNVELIMNLSRPLSNNQQLVAVCYVGGFGGKTINLVETSQCSFKLTETLATAKIPIDEDYSELKIYVELVDDEKVVLFNEYCTIEQGKVIINLIVPEKSLEVQPLNDVDEIIKNQELQQEEAFKLPQQQVIETKEVTKQEDIYEGDDYLKSLLEGLDDWDNF